MEISEIRLSMALDHSPRAYGGVGKLIGLYVVFAGYVGDGEVEGTCKFSACPVEGVEAGAVAGVLAGHLADNHLRIGEDAQHLGVEREGMLQGLEQGNIFSYVVVLVADPLRDPDLLAVRVLDHNTNPRGTGIAVRSAVYVGNKNGHTATHTMLKLYAYVKKIR